MNISKPPKEITLAHGSGGQAMQQLIASLFLTEFDNPLLGQREDQARMPLAPLTQQGDRLAFTTDSYGIDPIFFPGGDIGKLAVCGTVNDLAVSGAQPLYLSCGFIIEEGFPGEDLMRVVTFMAHTAQQAGVQIVTGDTKMVPRGAADKLFINTAGIGVIPMEINWGLHISAPVIRSLLPGHWAITVQLSSTCAKNWVWKRNSAVIVRP